MILYVHVLTKHTTWEFEKKLYISKIYKPFLIYDLSHSLSYFFSFSLIISSLLFSQIQNL